MAGYRLEVRTVQAAAFKILIEALKELLTDTCLEFDETGIKVVAMDTSHVVLVHLKLEAAKFELYHCDSKTCIGVNMINFHKLIKTINNNDTLTLYIDNDDLNHMSIKIENSEKGSKTTYKLNLMDLDNQKITVDPAEFSSIITLPSSDFQKICRDMHNIAEYMEIKSLGSQLIFSCKGDFCSQETILCDTNHKPSQDVVSPTASSEIIQGIFSIKHLVLFTKCTNLCNQVQLLLRNDYPLLLVYDVASLGSVRLALAPHM
jgi:proliferating cell nuclear antigen